MNDGMSLSENLYWMERKCKQEHKNNAKCFDFESEEDWAEFEKEFDEQMNRIEEYKEDIVFGHHWLSTSADLAEKLYDLKESVIKKLEFQ